jgi:two-component sensor histidine kinase
VTSRGQRLLERLPLLMKRRVLAYALAGLLSVAAWWVRWILDPAFPPGFPYLTFFPAVILSSFLFGRGPGILAAILCGFLAWYWFIGPMHAYAPDRGTLIAVLFYAGVVAVDIALVHWMQRANRRLRLERERSRALAAESARLVEHTEILFHELQHRVANNLQMAGAVLTLQKRTVADPAAVRALDDAAHKLQLIGRIQRQLYNTSGEQESVDVFLRQLVDDLAAATGKPGVTYAVEADPGIALDPTTMIPVALIMAEAIANAIEHGFAGRDRGLVTIRAWQAEAWFTLEVHNDGDGLPDGFAIEDTTSLGLTIAQALARQLGGTFTLLTVQARTVARLAIPTGPIGAA